MVSEGQNELSNGESQGCYKLAFTNGIVYSREQKSTITYSLNGDWTDKILRNKLSLNQLGL